MKENKLKSVASALAYQRTVGVDIRISDLENKIADIKANCDLAIEGRDIKIMELEHKLEQTEKDLTDYQFNYPTIKELEKENKEAKGLLKKEFNPNMIIKVENEAVIVERPSEDKFYKSLRLLWKEFYNTHKEKSEEDKIMTAAPSSAAFTIFSQVISHALTSSPCSG